jgi:hypothetical protein
MKWEEYLQQFEMILNGEITDGFYSDQKYLDFVKLNNSRVKRWLKRTELSEETISKVKSINTYQKWVLITEAWCGDAAHVAPVIYLMSQLNDTIELEVQLRDKDSEIESYLTNGGKAIPKLIVRDEFGQDLFTWGPRPVGGNDLMQELKKTELTSEEKKAEIQRWYNEDKGISIQNEIADLSSMTKNQIRA